MLRQRGTDTCAPHRTRVVARKRQCVVHTGPVINADAHAGTADGATSDPNDPGRPRAEPIDLAGFAAAIRERRTSQELSQRQAAAEAGVSFSTWSRVEAGSQPDLASFGLLCAWLRVPAATFFTPIATRETAGVEQAISHLQADPHLPPGAARAISAVLREMYRTLAVQVTPRTDVVACHLRAASTLRPGVPERLAGILRDIYDGLERQVEADTP